MCRPRLRHNSGTTAATATLTINTISGTSSAAATFPPRISLVPGGIVALALICFIGVPARRRNGRALFSLLIALALGVAIGCGANSGTSGSGGGTSLSGTTTGAYTVTVTGASASSQTSSISVSLTVN